ncbi:MAG TPA: hypothetical protein VNK07_00235 [Candidatus Binatia bacterium]|jgi:hypothetical protein|uniref:Uncharacterized protein n=1 Tax=Candidatus Nitrosotenuis uzonensis TaxID=1407055 RepID=A0A812F0G7_9ARCH|nr:hypothetical protein [Candidatus Nitrosotenuis uzonensis]CAE6485720.1 hypothetical protein NUZ5A_20045 [Candidatus Nitrosotenuis uzonensis]HWP52466.1 hypothetical protein [Candidatus Binatia bacterium]
MFAAKGLEEKRPIKDNSGDEFLKILIEKRADKLDALVQKLAEKNNPRLLSIKKVEGLFKKNIEFNSRSHLLRELKGSMKASVLNTIIAHLVLENKLVVNDDHSLTWIDTEGNEKLNKVFEKAVPL